MSFEASRRGRPGLRQRRILRALQVFALLTVICAVTLAWQESRPFVARLDTLAERTETILATGPAPASFGELPSSFARRARLEGCVTDWHDVVTSGGDADLGRRMVAGCLDIARRNLTIAPASSNDWMIAASLASIVGDLAATQAYLRRSLATGPTEQWIAIRRAMLMYRLEDRLDPDLRAQVDDQFALLLRTENGVRSFAERYVSDPSFRERIVSVAEKLDPSYQKRFLVMVRSLLTPQPPANPPAEGAAAPSN